MSKSKGSRTERELSGLFSAKNWHVVRSAGSGVTPLPNPDLLVGKKGRSLAIECKSAKGDKRRYIDVSQIDELKKFAQGFGAEAWIGVRFDGMAWAFLKPSHLGKSEGKGVHFFDKSLVKRKGIAFEDLVQK